MVKIMRKNKSKVKRSISNVLFDAFIFIILTLVMLSVLYPLYFIVIASISDPVAVQSGEVLFLPKKIIFDGYKKILETKSIWRGYANSMYCVIAGTLFNLFLTIPTGYAMSKKDLPGRKYIMLFFTFTMFFNGGMIPTYLLVKNLDLLNKLAALFLTDGISIVNLIIVKTYFENNIPKELYEAAEVDGCSQFSCFFKIAMPLAKSITAIMILYYGVGQWNQLFKGMIYIQDDIKYPLQLVLRNILVQNTANSSMNMDSATFLAQQRLSELIKYGVIIIGSLPPLIMYPFVQKYFKKGVMMGSIKG